MAGRALEGLRVLDCGDGVAAAYAASLLGHLGADVVKLEPPEGDSLRRRGPFSGGTPDAETGGLHLFLDQSKRAVTLDLASDAGQAELRQLAAAADVLLASGSATELRRKGLTFDHLRDANPRLVATAITPFGLDTHDQTAPLRDLCDLAAGAWLSMSPGALDDPNLPPLKAFGQQAHFQAGIHAAVAALGGVAARDTYGIGQQIDVSVQACIASQTENGLMHYLYNGRVASRLGTRIVGPWGMLQLSDGLLFIVAVTEDDWARFVQFMGNPEWADNPLFADRLIRAENNDALLPLIESELADRKVYETYVALQEIKFPAAPISTMADLLEHPHLKARGHFQTVDHPKAGRFVYPGAPWIFHGTPWEGGRRAPLLGEHTEDVRKEWQATSDRAPATVSSSTPAPVATGAARASERLPLTGVRVVAFTWVWAGPVAGLQLAHLGADVIRIECRLRLDTLRAGAPPFWQEVRGPNRSGYVNQYSQGKRSVTFNLKHPRGPELAKELIRRADVVVDNFGAGAIERMGLGYNVLKEIKPDIIQISMAGHGQTGPIAKYVAYGPTQVPMIGLASLTGYPGGGPREVGISYGDPNGGMQAAYAVLAALHYKRRTGEGQYIDMSQWEAAVPLVAEGLLTYQMDGKQPERMGNRDQFEAPQGVFRSSGDDQWVAISCWSDAEWRALATAIGRPDLRDDPGLATREGRKAREAELEAAISAWTAGRTREEAARTLRADGVPAQPVLTTEDVAHDPELAARGFWVELPHCECTGARHIGIPWTFSGTPLRVRRSAPCIGEDTEDVLRHVIGISAVEIEHLQSEGALE